MPGQAAIADGVRQIAGGIGSVLQRLRVHARHVALRLELPPMTGPAGTPFTGRPAPGQLFLRRYAAQSAPPTLCVRQRERCQTVSKVSAGSHL